MAANNSNGRPIVSIATSDFAQLTTLDHFELELERLWSAARHNPGKSPNHSALVSRRAPKHRPFHQPDTDPSSIKLPRCFCSEGYLRSETVSQEPCAPFPIHEPTVAVRYAVC